MADIIDQASERTEQFLAYSLHKATKCKPLPPPSGLCFNCEEPVANGERWCDCDCRDDWTKRESNN